MKKWLAMLGIIACVFSLSACSSSTEELAGDPVDETTSGYLIQYTEGIHEDLEYILTNGLESAVEDDKVYKTGLDSYRSALADLGDFQGYVDEKAVQTGKTSYTASVGLDGSDHDADLVVNWEVDKSTGSVAPTQITTNVRYSFGELMGQAALNTLLGMGTTFVVLIFLAVIISLFRYIPDLQAKFSGKKEAPAAAAAAAPAAAPAAAEAEEEVDDLELIAVISAAIAAYEGEAGTDGFVVRSIRKARPRA